MLLPNHVFALVQALHATSPSLVHGDDDARRILQRKIVETVVARHPGEGWGWKKASETRPPSKDAIANNKLMPGHLLSWDCFDGSTRAPAQREADVIDGQVFIEVTGVDHLAGLPIPKLPTSGSSGSSSGGAQLPSRAECLAALTWLDTVYRQQLGRPGGVDLEGIAAHIFDSYLGARLRGASIDDAKAAVVGQLNAILGRTDIRA